MILITLVCSPIFVFISDNIVFTEIHSNLNFRDDEGLLLASIYQSELCAFWDKQCTAALNVQKRLFNLNCFFSMHNNPKFLTMIVRLKTQLLTWFYADDFCLEIIIQNSSFIKSLGAMIDFIIYNPFIQAEKIVREISVHIM